MKRVIRNSLFETASSSIHAVVIDKKKVDKHDIMNEKLYITHGEYGWEDKIYRTPSEKASYIWQLATSYKTPEEAVKAVAPLEEILYDNGITFEYEDGYFEPDSGWLGWSSEYVRGDVDHVGCGDHIVEDFKKHTQKLIRFLFGEKSIVVTGNDNSNTYEETMYNLGYAVKEDVDKYGPYYTVLASTKDVDIMEKGN